MGISDLKMYNALAEWWPILSAPGDYYEEAMAFKNILLNSDPKIRTLLELGSGGGNNASHLKKYFKMTLVDISKAMLEVSKKLNPDCEHLQGDMRTFRINRIFDSVFIHDAIMYMTSTEDVKKALKTANIHCKMNGNLLVVPDFFKETFKPSTRHGGHDSGNRSLRYLEWDFDPNPDDEEFETDFVFMIREVKSELRIETDHHECGVFSKNTWLNIFNECGFKPEIIPVNHSKLEPGKYNAILGLKIKDI
jgi:ubiquinone/menaquinone biosynthesis C-methylase UbiE